VKDRQDFELKAFDARDGKLLHAIAVKAAGEMDEAGRSSATAQNGKMALLGRNDLVTAQPK